MNARHIFFIAVSLCIIFVGNDCFAADTVNSDIIAQVVKSFADKTENWTNIAVKYARMLFYWCAVLQLALLGIEAALGASDIGTTFKKLCMAVFTGGFFFAVITHYSEWSRNIINGMMSIAGEMGGIENSSDNAFKMGLEICSDIWARMAGLGIGDISLVLCMAIALFITIICFCLITAQVIFIKCEAFVAMLAACILLGFGTLSIMRDYAVNVLRYILAVAFKLFVMQLVIGIGYSFLKEAVTPQADLPSVCVIIGASIVLLALVKSLPDTVAGIIQGSHIGSGVALQSTAAAVGGAMIGGAVGAAAGANNVRLASQLASEQGKTGMGMVTGTAGNLASAGLDAMHKRSARADTTSSVLREQIMQHKADAEAAVEAARLRDLADRK
ncbi:MAG TPA: P-type conjugative transfer protein TrbL [Candidatus Desulfovibrio intestinigallinarum]|nr:P-type conjugative transfer protein TrbL [Candidatus Desulfovibrio intestinigallinarum]